MFISTAFAQTSAAVATDPNATIKMIVPLILMFAVFYFLLIRPQQKKMKEHRATIDAVKKGDQVITAGGLVGKVLRVDEAYADVEIAQGVKVKVVKSTLSDVVQPGSTKPAND